MHNINDFSAMEMEVLGESLRHAGDHVDSMEQAAQKITNFLYDFFVNESSLKPAFVLVRLFKTHPITRLPSVLKRAVLTKLPENREIDQPHCLTLLGSRGHEAHWNSRHSSMGHQAIPLYSEDFTRSLPMVANLLTQLGLKISDIINPAQATQIEEKNNNYNVFLLRKRAQVP